MFKVKLDEQERTAMSRMDENHIKGIQYLEMVKEDLIGFGKNCLSEAVVCMLLFLQVGSRSMAAFYRSINGFCDFLTLSPKKALYSNIKEFSIDAQIC